MTLESVRFNVDFDEYFDILLYYSVCALQARYTAKIEREIIYPRPIL